MAQVISRIYNNFRGVDFRGNEVNLSRSPDSLNMWKNYKETDSIRTRPEKVLVKEFNEPIYGIWFFAGQMIVHSGNELYKVVDGVKTQIYSGVLAGRSCAFIMNTQKYNLSSAPYKDYWFFLDGANYLKYDGTTVGPVSGYIPTTSIGRTGNSGGTVYEDVNMLSSYRKNTFMTATGKLSYYLDTKDIDTDYVPVVSVNDVPLSQDEYLVSYTDGIITIKEQPALPLTDGQDNMVVKFKKTVPEHQNAIAKCTMVQVFDNRVFFSGNPLYPNMIWHSALNDPSYVSDLDYYTEGTDMAKVTSIVAGNNALWVFREPSDMNTTLFYHVPVVDDQYGKIYPSSHSSITTGCIGKAINFNDDIIFFSDRGCEGVNGDIESEQAIAHRSSLIDRKLTNIATNKDRNSYKNMVLAEWEGYLMVFIGNKVYLADSRATFTNGNHYEYEWYYWDLTVNVNCASVYEGILYIGSDSGYVYSMTGDGNIKSYWVTALDRFSTSKTANDSKLKTTNKRGCVCEATGDISVYAKTEKTDFQLIDKYENITDYFVSRIKRKKFKDLQLKFYSDTRFSLESVTLEAFVGGYIKR